jgi:hypothetical protein
MASAARRNRRKLIIDAEKGKPIALATIAAIQTENHKRRKEKAVQQWFEKTFAWLYWIAEKVDSFFSKPKK